MRSSIVSSFALHVMFLGTVYKNTHRLLKNIAGMLPPSSIEQVKKLMNMPKQPLFVRSLSTQTIHK
jgi:hypothetical protein